MKSRWKFEARGTAVGFVVLLLAGAATLDADATTPAQIQAAVERGKAFLYSKQKPGGHWELDGARVGIEHAEGAMQGDTFGGFTALATYALLAAGEDAKDERVAAAVKFLEEADVIGIYALGMRANVWGFLSDKRAKLMADRDAKLILNGMETGKENPQNKGFWDYGNGRGPGLAGSARIDHSVSQYGVLGLWACALDDVPIPHDAWLTIEAGWKSHQYPDGGWTYDSAPPEEKTRTAAMTAAGIAALFITDDMVNTSRGVECRGNVTNDNIERGIAWITTNFSQVNNPYALYGVERIGVASGRKYLGNIDWYAVGSKQLIETQNPDGSWRGSFTGGENQVTATSFALLFLTRGRLPAVINKLEYEVSPKSDPARLVEGDWNERPRDVANFVRWTGHQLEKDLSWQIVSLKAPVEEIESAPVLYLSGDQELRFSAEYEAKLRQFVLTGGMIMANADCPTSHKTFGTSFEELGRRLFPGYQFRDLPTTHPIYTDQPYQARNWKSPQRLRGLSNGVREFLVLMPDSDPSRTWQTHTDYRQDPAFQLGADVYLYAIDRHNIGEKGETHIVRGDPDIIADRGARVARLMIGNNPDPEPGGWDRIAAIFHNQYHVDVDAVPMKLDDKRLVKCRIAHLTGTGRLELKPEQRLQLLAFINHGGTLIVDAAGGNKEFADSAEKELKATFGAFAEESLDKPLPPENPVFNLPGAKISAFTYREIYRREVAGSLKLPRLNGIEIGKRLAVFFSREDLTEGMLGEQVDGIAGYSPLTATEIMRNLVLYSAFGGRVGSAGGASADAR